MTDVKMREVDPGLVFISPARRLGELVHVARARKIPTPAMADELLFIHERLPQIAAFASGDVSEALAKLERSRVAYEQATQAAARERAELARRLAQVAEVQVRLGALTKAAAEVMPAA